MNKIGFCIRVEKVYFVIILSKKKQVYIADVDNKNYITSAECINGKKRSILSFLILKGAYILHKERCNNGLEENIKLTVSNNGYCNNVLALKWLKYFNVYFKTRQTSS